MKNARFLNKHLFSRRSTSSNDLLTTTCGAHVKMYIAAEATSSGSNVGNDANASSEYVL